MNNYLLFFEKIKIIYDKYQSYEDINDFNIFSVMFKEHDEVNLHSKFLYEMLTNTNLSKEFLRLFLKILDFKYFEEEFVVIKEYKNIDLVLKNKEKVIIIENKIYAYDQEEQLFKYYNKIISENYKKENIFIYYLTLDGREPSLNSIQNLVIGKDIRCISYKEEILEWIKHCMKESIFDNALREILNQYRRLIMILSGKTVGGKATMEIKNHIVNSSENLEIAVKLVDSLIEAKIELQLLFWSELENELIKKGYLLEDISNQHFSKKTISNFYKKTKNNKWYGMSYKIYDLDSSKKIYLTIEIYDNVYWGFRVVEKKNVINDFKKFDLLKEKYMEMLSETGIDYYDDSKTNWIGYMKFRNKLNFREFNHRDIFNLANLELRKEIIQNCLEDIEKSTSIFLEKLGNI